MRHFFCLLLLLLAAPVQALVLVVDRTDDVASVSGCDPEVPIDCSLRTAISIANVSVGPDEILLPSGTFTISPVATYHDNLNQDGDLDVLDDLTIHGVPGDRPEIVISATLGFVAAPTSILQVHPNVNLKIHNVDMTAVENIGVMDTEPGIEALVLESMSLRAEVEFDYPAPVDHLIIDGPAAISSVEILGNVAIVGPEIVEIESSTIEGRCFFNGFSDVTLRHLQYRAPNEMEVAINSYGILVIEDSEILGPNIGDGGGIRIRGGEVTVRRSVIRGQRHSSYSVLSIESSAKAVIEETLFVDNKSPDGGGAIQIDTISSVSIEGSTFAGNEAQGASGFGGAIAITGSGPVEIRNSTFTNNDARFGGAIWVGAAASVNLEHVTISGNDASAGSGLFSDGNVNVTASLIDDTCAGPDLPTSLGNNLESPGASCGFNLGNDQSNVNDPKLLALNAAGGMTPTLVPLPGSPARDTVVNCTTATDQRGMARPFDGGSGLFCDTGAVEAGYVLVFADGFEEGDTSAWSAAL